MSTTRLLPLRVTRLHVLLLSAVVLTSVLVSLQLVPWTQAVPGPDGDLAPGAGTAWASQDGEDPPPRRPEDLLFDADVEHRGLSAYAEVIHGERISVVDDPVLGDRRQVMRFTVQDGDTGPTADPRAQVETPEVFEEGDELWIGWSTLFPSGWPDRLPAGGTSWLTLSELYGPPYAGAAPVKLGMRSGVDALSWQRNGTYGWDVPWEVGPLRTDHWYDQVLHVRLSSDGGSGFVELYLDTGDGWEQQTLAGELRLRTATLDGSNDAGPNHHKLALYRKRGLFPVLTVYHAEHRVGTTFDAVAPRTYS